MEAIINQEYLTKVQEKGQVVIPLKVRKKLEMDAKVKMYIKGKKLIVESYKETVDNYLEYIDTSNSELTIEEAIKEGKRLHGEERAIKATV